MIIKYFDLKKNLKNNINFYLLYGQNSGLIEDTINNVFKPNFSKNTYILWILPIFIFLIGGFVIFRLFITKKN